jgi:hypothetical protein
VCPDVVLRPPAARGDVYRAAASASVIAIIDGFYEHQPPVWHKEVLHAISRGCHVIGGSSMGAIRAAELDRFGMIGVGRIYDLFRCGDYRDADVSVAHGPAPEYRSLSEPIADVHRTLDDAQEAGIVGPEAAELLLGAARAQFYADRTYPSVIDAARCRSTDPTVSADFDAFTAWWPDHRTDQKRLDAIAVLEHAAALAGTPPPAPTFAFNRTAGFEAMIREERGVGHDAEIDRHSHDVVEEAWLDPALSTAALAAARYDALAEEVARLHDVVLTQDLVDTASDRIRRRLGLAGIADVEVWMERNGLDWDDYAALVRRRARIEWVEQHVARGDMDHEALVDWLRLEGHYPELVRRSRAKAAALRAAGLDDGGGADHLDRNEEALAWWRADQGLDDAIDPLAMTGFSSLEALARAARRERAHRRIEAAGA